MCQKTLKVISNLSRHKTPGYSLCASFEWGLCMTGCG